MKERVCLKAVRLLLVAGILACLGCIARAATLVEHSAEVRLQLDLHVSDSALRAYLPPGWTLNVATQGPPKDANLRVIFIDRLTINGPDGKPLGKTGSNRLVYLVAPVKDPSGAAAQLVIGGLTADPADAPGPYGVYLPAVRHFMRRTVTSGNGPVLELQDWVFTAATGEHLELHIKFERGPGVMHGPAEVKYFSAKNPGFYRISRQTLALDILRNVTTKPPDHVQRFSFKASGGSYAKLFDGTEKLLSWDDFVWVDRDILRP